MENLISSLKVPSPPPVLMEPAYHTLPQHIIDKVIEVRLWFANQGVSHWQVAGVRSIDPPTPSLPAQAGVLEWAVRSFGPIAHNVDERAARVAEEAIEIAQIEGVPLETIKRIADRVYSRPAGERWQEIGGTMIGMLSYAQIVGLSLTECTRREFDRVLAKPREWWQRKHADKVAAGTADLSPCSISTEAAKQP